jgi:toxin ParE1/3/4
MTYRTTIEADEDIAGAYVAGALQFGVDQAERYQDGLFAAFALLASQPRLARLRDEFTPPVRLHPYQAHMIVFVEEGAGVLIVRVLHGRQDWENALA